MNESSRWVGTSYLDILVRGGGREIKLCTTYEMK